MVRNGSGINLFNFYFSCVIFTPHFEVTCVRSCWMCLIFILGRINEQPWQELLGEWAWLQDSCLIWMFMQKDRSVLVLLVWTLRRWDPSSRIKRECYPCYVFRDCLPGCFTPCEPLIVGSGLDWCLSPRQALKIFTLFKVLQDLNSLIQRRRFYNSKETIWLNLNCFPSVDKSNR